ncbi:hypothetical protein SAMN02910356_02210 [Selenomonas sp. GACV-9]|uniref:hypothetical protein n=1 Tax=Selenomonas sp. GACV-9 TaxID=3158782 RepID=UPI0008E71038|nr:hypothetical protein SAMN02910356_02210 [Selenomonas ruminantium]
METILMIVFFALFAVLSDKMGKKPKVPRRPQPGSKPPVPWPQEKAEKASQQAGKLGFKIPELRNAPSAGTQGSSYDAEAARRQAEEYRERLAAEQRELAHARERAVQEAAIRAAEQAEYERQAKVRPPVRNALKVGRQLPVLTPANAQQAVVLAEILGKPKAYRNRCHR